MSAEKEKLMTFFLVLICSMLFALSLLKFEKNSANKSRVFRSYKYEFNSCVWGEIEFSSFLKLLFGIKFKRNFPDT